MDYIIAFLGANPGWSWMIAGAVLFALDVMAPGFFLLWFGAAAAVVGLIVFAIPIEFTWQILVFCGVSVLSVLLGRALWGSNRGGVSDKPSSISGRSSSSDGISCSPPRSKAGGAESRRAICCGASKGRTCRQGRRCASLTPTVPC